MLKEYYNLNVDSNLGYIWDKIFKSGVSKFFKGCLPQYLLSPLLNTLSHLKNKVFPRQVFNHKVHCYATFSGKKKNSWNFLKNLAVSIFYSKKLYFHVKYQKNFMSRFRVKLITDLLTYWERQFHRTLSTWRRRSNKKSIFNVFSEDAEN